MKGNWQSLSFVCPKMSFKLFTFASIFGTSEKKRCFTNESYSDIQQHATKHTCLGNASQQNCHTCIENCWIILLRSYLLISSDFTANSKMTAPALLDLNITATNAGSVLQLLLDTLEASTQTRVKWMRSKGGLGKTYFNLYLDQNSPFE